MMLVTAINTVEIDAAPGRVREAYAKLSHIVHDLVESSGCLSYVIADNRALEGSWIVSGYWHSETQMHKHFENAGLTGFMELLTQGLARRLNLNRFVMSQPVDTHHVGQ